jgi:hypothetical protein
MCPGGFVLHEVRRLLMLLGCAVLVSLGVAPAFAQNMEATLKERMAFWIKEAPLCGSEPTKQGDNKEPCNDGDMTLFSGLLCAAGVKSADGRLIGCDSVARAIDADGRWFRSPRRKVDSSIDADEHKRGVASFSPDMAMGVQLYLVSAKDTASAGRWINWLDAHRPCWAGNEPTCDSRLLGMTNVRGLPRFCTDEPSPPQPEDGDQEKLLRQLHVDPRCSMRPGDLALLGQTRNYMKVYRIEQPADADACKEPPSGSMDDVKSRFDKLERLLNITRLENVINITKGGLIYTLRLSCSEAATWTRLAAEFNRSGFSQHLVAVNVLLLRRMGLGNALLDDSARRLADKQPENAFFLFLNEGKTNKVLGKIIEHCPKTPDSAKDSIKSEWIWERDYDANKWHTKAALWDCLFMANLWLQGK